MIELICKRVLFWSEGDEAMFFSWAKAIPAVTSITGRGDTVVLTLTRRRVSASSYRELRALFRRYGISDDQLSELTVPRTAKR